MTVEPNNVTIELRTGSFIHLAHTPSEILYAKHHGLHSGEIMQEFKRMQGVGVPFEFDSVWIDTMDIVAIYPLSSHPDRAPRFENYVYGR
jgi:hypothetical protein